MKFKYYLRGLGTGIIFASVICLIAFQSADSRNISDKEVIERAKELGMVEKEDSIEEMFNTEKSSTEKGNVADNTEKDVALSDKDSTEKESTNKKQSTEKETKKTTTEKTTTEKTSTEEKMTETTTEEKNKEKTTEKEMNTNESITITIRGGMSSFPVCQMLQEAGVIENAAEFDDYLIKNGYANRISVGTHTLKMGMTYKEIAVAISDPE